ncbi:MAG TPA: flavodoxin-dependent (E)-4-hydroxy-3-methylbut-2-enyl-diphosphate synthase, partial [Bacteroidales bacterium]
QRKDLSEEILQKNMAILPVSEKPLKTLTSENFPVVSNTISSQVELFKLNRKELGLSSPKGNISQIPFKEISFNKLSKAEKPIIKLSYRDKNFEKLQLFASAEFSVISSKIKPGGIWIDAGDEVNQEKSVELSLGILQAMGLRFSKTEFIACPSCGRTQFNLMAELEKVKSQTSHLKGLKIAVMGCIVNGPGEMVDADYGYVGAGPGKVTLYKGKEAVLRNVEEEKAVDLLIELIKKGGDWRPEGIIELQN